MALGRTRGKGPGTGRLSGPVLEPGLKSREMVAVLSAIQAEFPGLASLTLTPMDPGSHSYQTLLGAMRIKGWIAFEYFTFGNWYQPVTFDWASYLAARSGPRRRSRRSRAAATIRRSAASPSMGQEPHCGQSSNVC